MSVLHESVAQLLLELKARRALIAYSGGADSTALLHSALHCFPARDVEVVAVHVNHGLDPAADEWERFCRRQAATLGAAFLALQVNVAARGGVSLEGAARSVRYAALKAAMRSGDVLMTAHHRDDQAETLLLQLLRGGGPEGLAGMPACARFGAGQIVRPFLDASRAQLRRYLRDHQLEWIEDPMNQDLRYDRAYLRRILAPSLHERWPAWRETLSRAARHQAAASELIRRFAQQRCRDCLVAGGALSVERCFALDDVERKAVLRYWIKRAGLPTPSEKQLLRLIAVMLSGTARSGALVNWPGAEVRHYRGRLYAMAPLVPPADRGAWRWPCGADLELPEIPARLSWRELAERAPELGVVPSLSVRLRRGGEKCAFAGGRFHKSLKKVFQELGVPPWERDRVPLIYLGDELRLVWNSPEDAASRGGN